MKCYWNQIWTMRRWERAQELRAKGFSDASIASDLGLTKTQVAHKFSNEAHAHRASREKRQVEGVLIERDALFATPRTLTELVCGDPLPGRSALDKQRMNLAEKPQIKFGFKVGLP
jgi:hypothetical protein